MGNYTIFRCSKILGEAGKQEILQQIFRKNLDLKSSSEQIFSKNCWVPLLLYLDTFSVRIQNTFSKIRVVYIKRHAYQSEL